ncbi:hypothetical protein HYW54_00615 [Candidatus Gottesmanbacteria bacterium]|nr:hypothetical protein [Candidatus Gottesmanbacteria bacterium]
MAILKDAKTKGKTLDSPVTNDALIHSMDKPDPPISGGWGVSMKSKKYLVIGAVVIALGILTGVLLPKGGGGLTPSGGGGAGLLEAGKKVFGSDDTKLFKDTTEGTIEEGGIDGEGTHKLVRPGGESQTVYINSTVLDLDQFVGKKVKVWGQTHAAQKAGWLMDVGRVELME